MARQRVLPDGEIDRPDFFGGSLAQENVGRLFGISPQRVDDEVSSRLIRKMGVVEDQDDAARVSDGPEGPEELVHLADCTVPSAGLSESLTEFHGDADRWQHHPRRIRQHIVDGPTQPADVLSSKPPVVPTAQCVRYRVPDALQIARNSGYARSSEDEAGMRFPQRSEQVTLAGPRHAGENRQPRCRPHEDLALDHRIQFGGTHWEAPMLRVGTGQDIHALVPQGVLVLAGVALPGDGFETHSDGDVIAHAIIDSIAGALAIGTLGDYFPENDPKDQDAVSIDFLTRFLPVLEVRRAKVVNLDITVELAAPRLAPHLTEMRENIASRLRMPLDSVSIKPKSNDGLGETGRGEAAKALVVCLVELPDE